MGLTDEQTRRAPAVLPEQQPHAARAAVAELIEAAQAYRRAVADEATLSGDHHRRARWLASDRLDAAIAACKQAHVDLTDD